MSLEDTTIEKKMELWDQIQSQLIKKINMRLEATLIEKEDGTLGLDIKSIDKEDKHELRGHDN